mgnify:CR=1 FL=1
MTKTISSPKNSLPIEKKSKYDVNCDNTDIINNQNKIEKNKTELDDKVIKYNKNYCFMCNKRLKLMYTFDCRCGENFCSLHRTPEYHNCTFDYTKHGNKTLENKLEKIDQDKIRRF